MGLVTDPSVPGWQVVEGKLHRELIFADFSEAFAFMVRVAMVAEQLDHHPDWSNSWNTRGDRRGRPLGRRHQRQLRGAHQPHQRPARELSTRGVGGVGQALGDDLVDGLGQRVPRQRGALDAHRELHHAPQRLEVAELARRGSASVGASSRCRRPRGELSWIDIMALKAWVRSCTSSMVLPLTAADIIEADDWLMEQPWPAMRMSRTTSVVDVEVDDDLVAAERVEPLDPMGRRHLAARRGSGGCGSGRG